jgi:hypothetical protein
LVCALEPFLLGYGLFRLMVFPDWVTVKVFFDCFYHCCQTWNVRVDWTGVYQVVSWSNQLEVLGL